MIKISFVIPTYNAGFHISNCLSSIRNQKYSQEKVEILILDGGSSDDTLDVVKKYNCRVFSNPKRLAEYGVQLGVQKAEGEFIVVFAADNELVGDNWIQKVVKIFEEHKEVSAVWGKLVSGKKDAGINKYFELIQNDPLNWFLNKNLDKYKNDFRAKEAGFLIFKVDLKMPLVWGANGLAYRSSVIKQIWGQEGYLGDNDAFQYMLEKGYDVVAYFNEPFVYHHHVQSIKQCVNKWRRNYQRHFLTQKSTRNLNWVFVHNFKTKLVLWILYNVFPLVSISHSVYLAIKDKNVYWLYHPIVSFLQMATYIFCTLFTPEGRSFIGEILTGREIAINGG